MRSRTSPISLTLRSNSKGWAPPFCTFRHSDAAPNEAIVDHDVGEPYASEALLVGLSSKPERRVLVAVARGLRPGGQAPSSQPFQWRVTFLGIQA